jgi:hypothetical protein
METPRVYAQTLQQAAEAAGGAQALARRLGVPLQRLRRWMAGYGSPPLETFLASLDIVAAGPELLGLTRSVTLPRSPHAPDRHRPEPDSPAHAGRNGAGRTESV